MTKKKKSNRIPVVVVSLAFVGLAWTNLFDFDVKLKGNVASKLGLGPSPTATPTPELTAQGLSAVVVPDSGYTVNIKWGDTGKKLVEAGGIDMAKYEKNYNKPEFKDLLTYLTDDKSEGITITKENAYFWVNTLWALGLTQQSEVLDEGVMGTEHKDRVGNFASTGGWTLGAKDAVSLYSSADIIPLTPEQHALVHKISKGIYRPCCGNPTSFPDCNHGMAILGLIELMVCQGYSEDEVYDAALAFNSYWFGQTYVDLAYYFQTEKGVTWSEVDAKEVLSAEYSSAQGYATIKDKIGNIPGSEQVGASCGA